MQHSIPNAVFVISSLLISPAAGHEPWGDHHHGNSNHCDHHSSRSALESPGNGPASFAAPVQMVIAGRLVETTYLPGATADTAMVEIRVLATGRTTVVRLAPVGLLKQSRLSLMEGDAISLTGFEVSGLDGDLIVATEIRKGDKRVGLRDTRGRPVW